jgi:hypothetical protein
MGAIKLSKIYFGSLKYRNPYNGEPDENLLKFVILK